ncbi:phosphoribosyltransferase [Stygiolobus caldivivus]|uniref:Phosphoribosyltransferase n=1 Tax=Stygiolobus caldivivus TaxID=2824673 RepID=A0A8D5ZIM3_9CREN|nr:phosphoribosyltransferase [Stygiolobus caldivivus]BCU69525.1 phosphoribosyltransferase [Stygiolobus caldivivus]
MVEYYIPKWEEIEEGILNMTERMLSEDFIPDVIVAILTGGVIPAKLMSDVLGIKNMRYIDVKFYKGVGNRESKPIVRAVYVDNIENKKVLVIDDVSDTGETLDFVGNVIAMFNPSLVRTATIFVKPWSRKYPDYYYKVVDKWIIFPWDKWEVVRENTEAPVDKKERFLEILKRLRKTG